MPSCLYNDPKKHLNIWWQGTCVIAVFFLVNIVLFFVDDRFLADEKLWMKPIKFEISIMIHFITLAILAALLSPKKRHSLLWRGMTYIVVIAGLFETLYIFLQATRERESHYNNDTIIESVMYGLMGLGAVILVMGSFYLGYLLLREYQVRRQNILLLSSAIGLTIGSILTLIIAGYLSSFQGGYVINADPDVLRLPVFSWYLNGQDLRIPHFFATHMMQIFPLYGLWLSRNNVSFTAGRSRLFYSCGIYITVVVTLFFLALHLN